eukprot:scpid42264/ scgid24058/ 
MTKAKADARRSLLQIKYTLHQAGCKNSGLDGRLQVGAKLVATHQGDISRLEVNVTDIDSNRHVIHGALTCHISRAQQFPHSAPVVSIAVGGNPSHATPQKQVYSLVSGVFTRPDTLKASRRHKLLHCLPDMGPIGAGPLGLNDEDLKLTSSTGARMGSAA